MQSLRQNRIKGCMAGALVGDCVGAKFEGMSTVPIREILHHLKDIQKRGLKLKYTDDTCLALGLAESVVQDKTVNLTTIARRFTEDFFSQKYRGFGASIYHVFESLAESNYINLMEPAKNQFDGSGSYGNGGAMRIHPLAIYGASWSLEDLKKHTIDVTHLTHSNVLAVDGAWLQCCAVHYLLNLHENELTHFDCKKLLTTLRPLMLTPEYVHKLDLMEQLLLTTGDRCSQVEVVKQLGHGIAALESVPTALFCFLKCQNDLKEIPFKTKQNAFLRTLVYAISLGGDTDTIATMACALTGTQNTLANIPPNLINACEDHARVVNAFDLL